MANQLHICDRRLSRSRLLQGGGVVILEVCREMILECGVDVSTLVILTTLHHMLLGEFLLIE